MNDVQCKDYHHQHIYIYRLEGPPCPRHRPDCQKCGCPDYENVCTRSLGRM